MIGMTKVELESSCDALGRFALTASGLETTIDYLPNFTPLGENETN